ncbi:MAG: TolC family protein [Deltaproteobacteria bacterium]
MRKLIGACLLLISPAICSAQPLPEKFLPAEAKQSAPRAISISEGIQRVLKDNRLIKISLPDKDMAFEDSMIARSALFPHLSASAAQTFYQYQPTAKFGQAVVFTQNKDPFSFGIDLYQTLFDFGKSLSNYNAAKEVMHAREANIESVRRMAVLEFIATYFDLLQTEKTIEVAQKEVESIQSYLNDIQKLYEQGVVVQNDLLPAQVRLADAKQRLIAAQNGREIAQAALNNLLALPLKENTLARDIEMHPPELPAVEEAWKIAEGSRPEIKFLDNMTSASSFSEKARARENLPELFVRGGYSQTENDFTTHEGNSQVMIGAKINIFEGGADRAQLNKERARQKQLKEQKGKLIEDIKFEVENSYVGLRNASQKVDVAKSALSQADENVRITRVKYTEGVSTTTDVLQAIALQTGAQTNYYSADYELKRTYARLMYSMGIDLSLVYERMERGQNERSK